MVEDTLIKTGANGDVIKNAIDLICKKSAACSNVEELARACLEVLENITGGTISFVGQIEADGLFHDIVSESGWAACKIYSSELEERPDPGAPIRGLFGYVLKTGKSLLTNSPSEHPESNGLPEGHPVLNSFLSTPYFKEGKVYGMIALANRVGGFEVEQLKILEALTPYVFEMLLLKREAAARP